MGMDIPRPCLFTLMYTERQPTRAYPVAALEGCIINIITTVLLRLGGMGREALDSTNRMVATTKTRRSCC
jgi:hypothetical protein